MFASSHFNNQNTAHQLLASEELMRHNAAFLRDYCRNILETRGLKLAGIAYDYFVQVNEGKMRKDNITPVEQHIQLHILNLDALLKSEGNRLGWDEEKYGSQDAIFTAVVFHDMIEDDNHTDLQLLRILENKTEVLWNNKKINRSQHIAMYDSAMNSIKIVKVLSRNQPAEDGKIPNRTQHTNLLLDHPGAILIKLIDWTNKIATMPGVDAFECNNQARMRRNLSETADIFFDQRQALSSRAKDRYPEIRRKIEKLDAILGIVYHNLSGYAIRCNSDYEGDPRQEPPYNYRPLIRLAKHVLKYLPDGANLIKVELKRLETVGEEKPIIADYLKYVLMPAVEPLMTSNRLLSLKDSFNYIGSCAHKVFASVLNLPNRHL